MKLNKIIIKGFKSIRELELELRPLNVLIGPNGVGKSNFISIFRLLNEMVEGNFQNTIARGGGAGTFLHFGKKITERIEVELRFGKNGYYCVWAPAADDSLFFENEKGLFWGKAVSRYPNPLGTGHKESNLSLNNSDINQYVFPALQSWKVYHFHDTSDTAKVKSIGDINDTSYLRSDASNLAAFLYSLKYGLFISYYEAIRDQVRQVAPFFDDFILRPDPVNKHKIRLEWSEKGSDYPFMAYHLSDGTLRFMCLATLLLQPNPPSTILIDEPELGLHPYAITVLASLFRSITTTDSTQLIVSTQSVPLINQLHLEDILVVDRSDGQSTFRHLQLEEMEDWLDDYGLGDLWEKNLLGGRP